MSSPIKSIAGVLLSVSLALVLGLSACNAQESSQEESTSDEPVETVQQEVQEAPATEVETSSAEDDAAASSKSINGIVLSGYVHTHEEQVYNKSITVVSMTLDQPIAYTYEHKGTVDATAYEVELETSLSDSYGAWAPYDGRHLTVACDGLHGAIRDASMHGVDTLAEGEIRLVSVN